MTKIKISFLSPFLFFTSLSFGQEVYTRDVDNFWTAYDSVQLTNNVQEQIHLMQRLYVDEGTNGLKAFMELRNFNAERLVQTINDYPKFWESIRSNTFLIKEKKEEINSYVQKFKGLYPDYREASIYFTITAIRSGGTTQDSLVLIGTEIAAGNAETDVSEFPDKRLEVFFQTQKEDNIIPFVIHEYVHTQQTTEGTTLLGQSIYEGACDFITEIVLQEGLRHAYIQYGKANELELMKKFKAEMFAEDYSNWIYNGSTSDTVGDLGYFMGYAICRLYYLNAPDKKKAIKDIIELDYSDLDQITRFLEKSGYY